MTEQSLCECGHPQDVHFRGVVGLSQKPLDCLDCACPEYRPTQSYVQEVDDTNGVEVQLRTSRLERWKPSSFGYIEQPQSVQADGGSEVLPCPFCGSSAELRYDRQSGEYVGCYKCSMRTEGYGTPQEAVDFWNTRSQAEEVSRLRAALGELVEAVGREPYLYECVFTKGKHQGTTVKTIAFDDESVKAGLGENGYINGIGSLYANGLSYIPPTKKEI